MVKVLQWVYELGVKHERRRIAAYLQNKQYQAQSLRNETEASLVERPKVSAGRKAIKEKELLCAQIVDDIVSDIFRTEFGWLQEGTSIMFPEGDK